MPAPGPLHALWLHAALRISPRITAETRSGVGSNDIAVLSRMVFDSHRDTLNEMPAQVRVSLQRRVVCGLFNWRHVTRDVYPFAQL